MKRSLVAALLSIAAVATGGGRAAACRGDYTLEMSGQCPGYFILKWSGATPGRRHAILHGTESGVTIIPSGPCRGTVLGMAGQVNLVNIISTRDGEGSVIGYGGQVCHFFVQLLELGTCNTSNVVEFIQ